MVGAGVPGLLGPRIKTLELLIEGLSSRCGLVRSGVGQDCNGMQWTAMIVTGAGRGGFIAGNWDELLSCGWVGSRGQEMGAVEH